MLNSLKTFILGMFFFGTMSYAAVRSTQEQIKFYPNNDNLQKMELNGTGLGIGISPSANLHVSGNAIISDKLTIGSSSGSANLNIQGTLGFNHQTISSNTTLAEYSIVFVDSSNANITLTLPYAGNVLGRQYLIKKISTLNDVSVRGQFNDMSVRGQFIDNSFGLMLLSGSMQYAKLISTGNQTWSLLETSGNGASWSPSQVTTSAWYDASDASSLTLNVNGNVMQWNDKSGNGNHLEQSTGSLQPILNGQRIDFANGKKLVKSAGNNLLSASGNHALFFVHDVVLPSDTSNLFPNIFQNYSTAAGVNNRRPVVFYNLNNADKAMAHSYNNAGGALAWSIATRVGTRVISGTQDNGSVRIYFDGAQLNTFNASVTPNDTTHSSLNIGNNSTTTDTFSFYEIILIARDDINTATNQKIEGYLAWKWGLQNQLDASHPYKYRPPLN